MLESATQSGNRTTDALVAQLDRASDFDSEGREFESLRARQHLGLKIKGFLNVLASF
jgi:hypothetical protein